MGSRELMGNTFQKTIVLNMLMKNQQFVKIPCKQQRILSVGELHQFCSRPSFICHKTCDDVFPEPSVPALQLLTGTHHPLGHHPHLGCISHS